MKISDIQNYLKHRISATIFMFVILFFLFCFFFFSKYNVRRQTQHLSVPYYVKENFDGDYQGSLARLENSVEEDYIYTMKQHCFRERNYRKLNEKLDFIVTRTYIVLRLSFHSQVKL